MVKIELTSEQASELRQHYIDELEKLQQRSNEILALLKAISPEPATAETTDIKPAEEPASTGNQEKQSAPGWSDYILKLLSERKRAVTKDQIFKTYQQEYKVNFPDPNAAKNRLSVALHYLQNKKQLIDSTPRKGKRGNLYRLVEETPPMIEKAIPQEPVQSKPDVEKPKEVKVEKSGQTATVESPEKKFIQFIIDTLKKEKRIFNRDELLKYAMVNLGIPPQNKKSTQKKITDALTYMVKESGSLKKTKKEGKKGVFYGLVDWFGEDEKLIVDYR